MGVSGKLDVDFLNIQFYNQGPKTYDNYKSLMMHNTDWTKVEGLTLNTAVNQLINAGVPAEKIVIGKPIAPRGYANNGYVRPGELMRYVCEYRRLSKRHIGGIMTWMYPGARSRHLLDFGKSISGNCTL